MNNLQSWVDAIGSGEQISVDEWDGNKVWLCIHGHSGSRNCQLTRENARQLIAAINKVLESE